MADEGKALGTSLDSLDDEPMDPSLIVKNICSQLRDPESSARAQLDALNEAATLSERTSSLADLEDAPKLVDLLRLNMVSRNKHLRMGALRALRYLASTRNMVELMMARRVDVFVVRALEVDPRFSTERMQALKLIRAIMDVDHRSVTKFIVQSLVAISEQADDKFRKTCLEMLRELAVHNAEIVASCNGMKTLLHAMLDKGCADMADSLILTVLLLLNEAETRPFIRPSVDLQVLFAVFTDAFSEEEEKAEERCRQSHRAIVTMMRSWTGIICLTSDPRCFRTLVSTLKMPSHTATRKAIFNLLFEILRVKNPNNAQEVEAEEQQGDIGGLEGVSLPPRQRSHNMLNNYTAVILTVFIHCGIVETLVELGKREDKEITKLATVLLGEILYLADALMPPAFCERLHALPELVNPAFSHPETPFVRSRASTMVLHLDRISYKKKTSALLSPTDYYVSRLITGSSKWRRMKGIDLSADRIEHVRVKIDSQMDDVQFQVMLKKSQVLVTKDFEKWNWEIVLDMLEGPLKNPTRMFECMHKTKFIKRLVSHFRPTKALFTTMLWRPENVIYVRTGCQLLEVLLSTDEGRDYLASSKLMDQICAALTIEVNPNPDQAPNRTFSPEKVEKLMVREYFTLLGAMSSVQNGLEMLQKFKFFNICYGIIEMPERDDLIRLIVPSFDYNTCGHARILLSTTMTSGSKSIRYLCTAHLLALMRAAVADFAQWGIELLVTQLHDPDLEVANSALKVLDEACNEEEYLSALIEMRPMVPLALGRSGKTLFMRCLSSPNGYSYLDELDWILPELNLWFECECVTYVSVVESALVEVLGDRESKKFDEIVSLPPHFYGELVKTQQGIGLLKESGHFPKFVAQLRDDSLKPLHRRAALWAVGHIGSSELGFSFLEESEILPVIVDIAETSPCLSLRGTCFYVLGLISRTASGREMLDNLGWASPNPSTLDGDVPMISVPKDPDNFFKIEISSTSAPAVASDLVMSKRLSVNFSPANASPLSKSSDQDEGEMSQSELKAKILKLISNLANHVTQRDAYNELNKMRPLHAEIFMDFSNLLLVYNMFENFKFRLPVRRYISNLFAEVRYTPNKLEELTATQA